jgi:phosphate transport system permease protein
MDIRVVRPRVDKVYRSATRVIGLLVLAVMILVFVFLGRKAWPFLNHEGIWKFLTTQNWNPAAYQAGVGALLFQTVLLAVIALALAVPVSLATALYITEYAPRAIRGPMTSMVDLLAAIPSIIFGAWGFFFLEPRETRVSMWLSHHLGWIPIFKVTSGEYAASPFITGTVLALMIIPICTAIMRQVFSQAPAGEREGALALGGSPWGVIKTVVLPFGRGGIVGGAMLGLGRALGETIAVAILISPIFTRSTHILQLGANSIAAEIINQYGEATQTNISALMGAGLVLFVVTLAVNVIASMITTRTGAETEI